MGVWGMSWKDDYREQKEQSGLAWDEFVRQRLVHVDDITDAKLDRIDEHLQAVQDEYQRLRRELHETRVLVEAEREGDE